jgi:hypothetical protein
MMYRWAAILLVVGTLVWHPAQAEAALIIQAENAAVRTEGGPNPGGGWNLWSNGRVGQSIRVAAHGGGMLRADMSPKPVYEQLKRLIHEEWKTTLHATTDNDGRFTFRGFCGKYRLVLEVHGRKLVRDLQVSKATRKEVVVTFAL